METASDQECSILILKQERNCLRIQTNIFGSWLGYSSEHKLLLQANRPSRDMLTGEEGKRMIVYNIQFKRDPLG